MALEVIGYLALVLFTVWLTAMWVLSVYATSLLAGTVTWGHWALGIIPAALIWYWVSQFPWTLQPKEPAASAPVALLADYECKLQDDRPAIICVPKGAASANPVPAGDTRAKKD